MDNVKKNEFKCEICGIMYINGWSDEEARQECYDNFGVFNIDDCGTVCDDCYNEIMPNIKELIKPSIMKTKITIQEALEYEIRGSWWASFVPFEWLREIAASYFVWKVKQKHKRYLKFKKLEKSQTYSNFLDQLN